MGCRIDGLSGYEAPGDKHPQQYSLADIASFLADNFVSGNKK
jgi:hypothetical protein